MKVNGTHVHAVYENMRSTLFHVCCRRVDIFPNNINFTHRLIQGSGTFLAKGAMKPIYF